MKKIIAIAFFILYANFSFACSTFLLKRNEKLVFGKNYDWVTGNGMVVVNARGVQKTSFTATGEKSISWRSNWGSITFNQFGKEFPNGGMNEKGLVVELMWLPGTKYPPKDNRAAMNELQWIQFQLDNCSTVDEVIATDKIIRISNDNFAPLHYLIADANGNAATIEFIERKMVVHKGKDLEHPVLTNTIYKDALKQIKDSNKNLDNSVQRFSTACTMVQQFQTFLKMKMQLIMHLLFLIK
ncbi:MAG: linear amide C-N hydrolase [Chitinophagaceae bacterium]